MATKLYVGNLSYNTTEEQLRELFSEVGPVESVTLITDRHTGRSKGFGFIEMQSDEAAKAAIEKLNDTELEGRKLNVSVARPREERPAGARNYREGGYRPRRY